MKGVSSWFQTIDNPSTLPYRNPVVIPKPIASAVVLISLAISLYAGTGTNTWNLNTNADYYITPTNQPLIIIDQTQGVARLILRADNLFHTTYSEYTTNGSALSSLKLGPDVSLSLKQVGGLYQTPGTYTSRILDGGANNTWVKLSSTAAGRLTQNSTRQLTAPSAGLVALYRMDGQWRDEVSGGNAVSSGAGFVSDAKGGTHAGYFSGAYASTVNAGLLDNATSITYCCWIKLHSYVNFSGVICSRGTANVLQGLAMRGTGKMSLWVNSTAFDSRSILASEQWYLVVATWRSSDGQAKIYVDGVLDNTGSICVSQKIGQDDVFRFCVDDYDIAGRKTSCDLDEVAIFDRELSAEEVLDFYWKSYAFMFQVRSGNDEAQLSLKAFTGPGGSTNKYYFDESALLLSAGSFDSTNRYAQYRAYLYADAYGSNSPWIDAVLMLGDRTIQYDYSLLDFQSGQFSLTATNYPGESDTPYVGLAKTPNGGFYTNGIYLSRVFDATNAVSWEKVTWQVSVGLQNPTPGLAGLYHLNGNWADSSPILGGDNSGTPSNEIYPTLGKLGECYEFDGVASEISNFRFSGIQSIEFWISDICAEDGIMTVESYSNGAATLSISNGFLVARGFTNTVPSIYVNGRTGSRKLLPGWNHVAVTMGKPIGAGNMIVGVAGGDHMKGLMDEMGVYTREISGVEVKAHYLLARQNTAGDAKFQVRAGADYVSLTNAAWSASFGNGSADIAGLYLGLRYFQYRAVLNGDGSATPVFRNVDIQYNDASTIIHSHDTGCAEAYRGTFVDNQTRWYGDEAMLVEQSQWGPNNLSLGSESGLGGLWHFDEGSWASGITNAATGGTDGNALNGASPSVDSKVGLYCGAFDGSNDYVSLGSVNVGTNDFSVGAWVKSTGTNRTAVVTTYAGAGTMYYALEFNGDGVTNVPGQAAFVINDTISGTKVVSSIMSDLNDGRWHHLGGTRAGSMIHLYVDGDRVASTYIGAYQSLGAGAPQVAVYGVRPWYLKGYVDEVFIYTRALSDGEMGERSGSAYRVRDTGQYASEIIDAGRGSIWERLAWGADVPYGRPLDESYGTNVVALWHLDTNALDSAGSFDGAVGGGGAYSGSGRFDACLLLDGNNSWVDITDSPTLEPAKLTIEAWAYLNKVENQVVFDKSDGATQGYRIATDANGRPYFSVGNQTCKDQRLSVRTGKWTHLAGTYSGSNLVLYVDGEVRANINGSGTVASGNARIGADLSGNGDLSGRVDEVALHNRTLLPGEILDHYRAGAMTLKIQVKSGTSVPGIQAAQFMGPDMTTNTFYTDATGEDLVGRVPLGQYFQYKVYLATENHRFTPRLQGVLVDASSYATNHPNVDTAALVYFPGKLTTFTHRLATNDDSAVRYQVSGDNGTTWYYWPLFTNAWVDADLYGGGWDNASPVSTMNQYINRFYRQLYEKTGVNLKWRSFLHSKGDDQVALDSVSLGYSLGRIVVTFPNGTETDTRSLVVGTPYDITWSSLGAVSNNITIELLDGSNVVSVLGTGLTNSGVFRTVISEQRGTNYYIRVKDGSDPNNIEDLSDGPFWLREQLHVTTPDGGEKWFIGRTNAVKWDSPKWGAQNLEGPIDVWFSRDGGTNWFVIATPNNVSGTNTYYWNIPLTNWMFVAENAKMGVATPGAFDPVSAFYGDVSDNTFTNAGIVVTFPGDGDAINMGEATTLEWYAAGAGSGGVRVDFFDGVSWTNIATNAVCTPGFNTLNCVLAAKDPSEAARVRITANADPVNVTGLSAVFVLADINILTPVGGNEAVRSQWQIGTTNYVTWTAAGAGDSVDISYSPDAGSNWYVVASGWANTNSTAGSTITNWSPPWVVAGPPSSNALLRVQSVSQGTLFDITDPFFDVSGVQVTYPNGGEYWEFGRTNLAAWLYQAAGANVGIDVAYISSPTTNDYETLVASASIFNGRWIIPAANIRRPTTVGKLRIRAISPPSGIPMVDYSDSTFTIRGLSVTQPTNSATYTLGNTKTNGLEWYSARAGANLATVYYSTNGVVYDDVITFSGIGFTGNQDADPSINQKTWEISRRLMPSLTSRIKVVVGTNEAVSGQFVLRGIRMTRPVLGSVYNIGAVTNVAWRSAGLLPGAFVSNSISVSGEGGPYVQGGLPNNAFVLNPLTPWTVDPELDPTTNAVIKMVVTAPAQDTDIMTYSDPFTLKGIKFLSPYTGTNWTLRGQVMISFLSAGMGVGAFADIYYSPDGGATYDLTHPVASGVPLADGLVTVPWTLESTPTLTRMPSTNACLLAVSGSYASRSKSFRVNGLKVTAPTSADVLAVSDVINTIEWTGVGASNVFNVSFTRWPESTPVDFSSPVLTEPIATGVPGWSCVWVMTNSAVGSNVTIIVSDGTFTATSEVFQVVESPDIKISNPRPGDFWKVTETNEIRWVRAGNVSNAFWLGWSPYPYDVTNTLAVGAFPFSGGTYSYTWANIPNSLGKVRIIITNAATETVGDQFEDFEIAAKFSIEPLVGDLFALSTKDVNWTTYGSLFSGVDFYYSLDPFKRSNYWHLVNTAGPFTAVAHTQPSIYSWQLPNVKTNTVWLRIQDHSYSNRVFDSSKPGPYDDLGMLNVRYYTVFWEIMDMVTSNDLDNLSVIDSSGWSQSGLSCIGANTISHEYPWGVWNTAWTREFFFDKVVMYWESENFALGSPAVWTQKVYMGRSTVEPDYNAMANFSYETSNKVFTVHAWLERGGGILDTPSRCKITIYDEAGNEQRVLDSAGVPPDGNLLANGVFWMTWDASALSPSSVYFAKVDIEFSGVWYSSGLTFTLKVPVGEEIAGMIGGISNQVVGVYTTLVAHETAESAFRGRTDSNLNSVVTTLGSLTNLDRIAGSVSNLVVAVDKLTNLTVMTESLSNIWSAVTNISAMEDQLSPKITARATTIKTGSTNMFVYRTRMGLGSGPVITVQNPSGGTNLQANMAEIPNTGLYKGEVVFAQAWGLGEFLVSCRDNSSAGAPGDQITLQVVGEGYWTDAQSISSITSRMAYLETTVSNVWTVVGAMNFGSDFSNVLASVSNIEHIVNASSASNIAAIAAMHTDVSNVFASISNLQGAVDSLNVSNAAALATLGANVSNVFVSVSNLQVLVDSSSSSNTAAVAALRSDVSNVFVSVTNLQTVVSSMSVSNAAALAALGTDVSSILGGITNLSSLTNLVQLQNLTNLTQLLTLTNLSSSLSGVDLAAIQTGVSDLQTSMSRIDWTLVQQMLTDLATLQTTVQSSFIDVDTQLAGLAGMATALDAIGRQAGAATAAGEKAAKEARSAKTQVTAIQGAITTLKSALGEGDKQTAMAMLSSIKSQLASVQGLVSKQGSLQPVIDLIVPMAADINALAKRKNLDDLVTIPAELRTQTQITEKGMVQVNNKMAEIGAAIEFLNKLVDKVANPPEVITYWTTE